MSLLILISTVFILVSCVLEPEPQQNKTAFNGDHGTYEVTCGENGCSLVYLYSESNELEDGNIGLKYSVNKGSVKNDAMDSHRLDITFELVDTLYLTWYGKEEEKELRFPIGKNFFDRIQIRSDSIVNVDLRGAPYQTYRYGISSRSEKLPRGNTIERESNTDFLVHGLDEGYGITLRPLDFSNLDIKSEISLVYDYSYNYY